MNDLRIPGEPTNGWLVLIGGGEFSFGETREFDEFLLVQWVGVRIGMLWRR